MPDIDLELYAEALGEFPITGTPGQKLEAVVQYAIRAPSSDNSQPWRFRITKDVLELRADRSRALPVTDPQDRELIISCGAALFHVALVLRHFGTMPRIDRLPDARNPDLLARVHVGEAREHTAEDEALFHAIPLRRTFRRRFAERCLPDGFGSALEVAARSEGAWLQVFRTPEARRAVADLVAEGDRLQMSDKPMVVRMFDGGRRQAARDRRQIVDAPLLALLGTSGDTPYHWLEAGEAIAHMLLRAQVSGIVASFFNQPIEIPELRTRLQTLAGRDGSPQMLLRLGFGRAPRATPRRPVAEVVEA